MTEDTKLTSTSRWADEIEDDEEPTITLTAEPISKDGERQVVEIVVDPDTGRKKKIIRTFRLEKKFVSKGVIERKKWPKYGQSKRDPPGPNSATTVVGDDVQIQFLSPLGDLEMEKNPVLDKLGGEGKGSFVKCRYCQENHFSAKCPYKDAGIPTEFLLGSRDLMSDDKKVDSEAKPGIFVPPAKRGGDRRGETMMPSTRKDETTIRVSNLPESMSETDMQELCTPFGKIERIFLAKDRATGVCKGFAFVTYVSRDIAARALRGLNGYGYDHLILNVEWSKPAQN